MYCLDTNKVVDANWFIVFTDIWKRIYRYAQQKDAFSYIITARHANIMQKTRIQGLKYWIIKLIYDLIIYVVEQNLTAKYAQTKVK
jgi:hypothetical protein